MENAKIEKFKCDILGDFQTLCSAQCCSVFYYLLPLLRLFELELRKFPAHFRALLLKDFSYIVSENDLNRGLRSEKHFQSCFYLPNKKFVHYRMEREKQELQDFLERDNKAMRDRMSQEEEERQRKEREMQVRKHTVRNLLLSKNSTLISRENCRFFG